MKFIVDGTNVCYWREDRVFSFSLLLELLIQLKKRGDTFICFFDANIEKLLLETGINEEITASLLKDHIQYFKTVPSGNRADDYIIVSANRFNASIITNDKFESEQVKQYASKINWLSSKSKTQRLFKGQVMFFGQDFGNEWVLMIPDLGIEKKIDENIPDKLSELYTLLQNGTKNQAFTIKKPQQRFNGKVSALVSEKGFGFIQSEDYSNGIYFHFSELKENISIQIGDEVCFETGINKQGPIAINILKKSQHIAQVEIINPEDYKQNLLISDDQNKSKSESKSKKITEHVESANTNTEKEKQEKSSLKKKIKNNGKPQFEIVGKIILDSTDNKLVEKKRKQPSEKSSNKQRNLKQVSNEFKVNILSIADFLQSKGIPITLDPKSQISHESYELLTNEFPFEIYFFDKTHKEKSIFPKVNNPQALRNWWYNLSKDWQDIFKNAISISGNPNLSQRFQILNLKYLDCNNKQVKHLGPLRDLKKLEVLNCDNTRITGLEPLEELLNLKEINCSRNNITNLKPISNLENLQYLYCDNTLINSLEPIKNLTNLLEIDCGNTYVNNIKPLYNLTNLLDLWIYHTSISDLKPLENLKKLRELWCYNSQVDNLQPLIYLSDLRLIDCSNSKLSNSHLEEFKIAHPNCEVF
jgi:Leucine-rich repeat (LRR) protein/cold shock CspA family protein